MPIIMHNRCHLDFCMRKVMFELLRADKLKGDTHPEYVNASALVQIFLVCMQEYLIGSLRLFAAGE